MTVDKMAMNPDTLAAALRQCGGRVRFYVLLETPVGRKVELGASQVAAFLQDSTAFSAAYFGLTLEQHQEWIKLNGHAVCGATTKSGKRCGNYVSGRGQLPADEWLEAHGGRCRIHGGESSLEARGY